ncbi:MAG TPA: hypothetical protein VEU51_07685 [Candidatus Acidoferrales bacterium]|nr:hypothetical protein [Candidatus Acidoferrales bacterium]
MLSRFGTTIATVVVVSAFASACAAGLTDGVPGVGTPGAGFIGGPLTVDGPLVVEGPLTVGGPAEVHGGVRARSLAVGGPVQAVYPKGEPPGQIGQTMTGSMYVGGPLTVNGPLTVDGKLTVGGPLKTEVTEPYDASVTE